MKYIRPCEIIHNKEFLREPVHDTFKEIKRLSSSKIILRGEGTGRSTLLNYMESKKANTKQPFIRLSFDSAGLGIEENEIFTKEFFEHYWELKFSRNLLGYIKDYYEMTYYSDFIKYSDFVYNHLKQTIKFINESLYKEEQYSSKIFSKKEITGEVLDKFKKSMNIESVELGIDSFDYINNSDELTQKIVSTYFDLFDRTIIGADDESLPQVWYKTYFKEDSELYTFQPFSIEYGKNIEVIYNIIVKRIEEYNNSLYEESKKNNCFYKPFPLDWLDYDTLNLLVTSTNGNIRLILDIVNELNQLWELDYMITQRMIESSIQNVTKKQVTRKLQYPQPKLHL